MYVIKNGKICIIDFIMERKDKMDYLIYTDGSAKGNGKSSAVGGWAFAIYEVNSKEPIYYKSGPVPGATNNQMELTAMIEGIDYLMNNFKDVDTVTVCTDSAYICNCWKEQWYDKWLLNDWKTSSKKPVLNQQFWEVLIPYFENPIFSWQKVKGHDNDSRNNFVDQLAQNAASDYLNYVKGENLW